MSTLAMLELIRVNYHSCWSPVGLRTLAGALKLSLSSNRGQRSHTRKGSWEGEGHTLVCRKVPNSRYSAANARTRCTETVQWHCGNTKGCNLQPKRRMGRESKITNPEDPRISREAKLTSDAPSFPLPLLTPFLPYFHPCSYSSPSLTSKEPGADTG